MPPEAAAGTVAPNASPTPPPPVVWLLDSLRLGGAERLALLFAAEYARCGGRVRLISLYAAPPSEQALESEARRAGLDWTCLHARSIHDRAAWRRLQRALDGFPTAVLHAHLRYATLWGALAAWRRRQPLVVTLHVLPDPFSLAWRTRLLGHLERWSLNRLAHRVLMLGPAQAQAWTRAGLSPQRQCLLPNGAAISLPHPNARARLRARLGIPPDAPVYLTVAAVRAGKGWRDWLDVQAALSDRTAELPESHFIWLGTGPDWDCFRASADGLPGVHLPGLQMNVADWLATADVFLFPSHQEAMPTALAEALAAALPAAAYDLPANREVAAANELIHWAPAGDVPALARAAQQALISSRAAARPHAAAPRTSPDTALWLTRLIALYGSLAPALGPPRSGAARRLPDRLFPPTSKAPRSARQGPGERSILLVEFFSHGGLFHYSLQLATALARQGATVTLLTGRRPELTPPPIPGLCFAPVLPTWNPRQPGRRPWRLRLRRLWRGLQYVRAWRYILWWTRRYRPAWVLLGDLEHRCDAWGVAWLRRHGFAVADVCHNPTMFDRRLWRLARRPGAGWSAALSRNPAPSAASQMQSRRTPAITVPAETATRAWQSVRPPAALTRSAAWRQRSLAQLDAIFVHAGALARQIEQSTGRGATIIPHGNESLFVAAEAPGPDWKRRWGWPPERPIGLLFGTLTQYKGLPTLLAALAAIPASARPGLVVAGFPAADVDPLLWQRQAAQLGIHPWLRWELGYLPSVQVGGLVRAVNFIVLPYWEASQSGVAHLALTFGCPVIATTVGALSDVIHHEENGLLVPPRDVRALAAALESLTTSPALRQRLSLGATATIKGHDWNPIASQILCRLFPPTVVNPTDALPSGRGGCRAATAKSFVPLIPS